MNQIQLDGILCRVKIGSNRDKRAIATGLLEMPENLK